MIEINAASRLAAQQEKGWKVTLSFKKTIFDKGWSTVSYEFKPSRTIHTIEDARKAAVRKLKTGRPRDTQYKIIRTDKL